MKFIWVGIDKEIGKTDLENSIKKEFPRLKLHECALESLHKLMNTLCLDNVDEDKSLVIYEFNRNMSEFPFVIQFHTFQVEVSYCRIDIYLAYYLSRVFNCKTMVSEDGIIFNDRDPYWSIVFDNGEPFLGDDCGSEFYDESGEPIKIVRKLELSEVMKELPKESY